ncbi:MAG: hypothetical protein MK135_08605 [Polyangiaceae bacterium]|nr:hypothetical protein [Polyangiaceae bacterium]
MQSDTYTAMKYLREVDEGIFESVHQFPMMTGVTWPNRSVYLMTPEKGVFIYNPSAISGEIAEEISTLGRVQTLLSPILFHHRYLKDHQSYWPNAKLWGVNGHQEKCPDISFDRELTPENINDFPQGLKPFFISGFPQINEVVILHEETGTLLVADLVFNFQGMTKGFLAPLLGTLAGTHRRFAQSRIYRTLNRDKESALRSYEEILDQDIQRVIMSHGAIVEENAKDRLKKILLNR